MSEEKKPTAPAAPPPFKPAGPDRIPISKVRFIADRMQDLNSSLSSGVQSSGELTPAGTSYVVFYVPSLGAFEVIVGRNAKVADVVMVPREHVLQFTRAA